MAFQNGLQALITATGSSTDLGYFINSGSKPYQADVAVNVESFDSTGFATTPPVAMSNIGGIGDWSGSFTARFPQASPAAGQEGLVTFANGYVLGTQSWSMTATITEFDDTAFDTVPPSWRAFSPGLYSITGNWVCQYDDTTSVSSPVGAGGSGAASFRMSYISAGNDNIVSCSNIVVTGRSLPFVVNGKTLVQYGFVVDGILQVDGDTPFWAVSVGGTPNDITPPTVEEIVLRGASGKTHTGDAFTTGWTIGTAIGSGVEASVSFRGTGALVDS